MLENPILDNPTLDLPTQEKPVLEKPTQSSKDIIINDLSHPYQSYNHLSVPNSVQQLPTLVQQIKEQIDYWDLIERNDKEYVLECLHKCGSNIRNIKHYLITALFNAPATCESYYGAAVRRDLEFMRQ